MHELANTLSFKHHGKMPSLRGLRFDVVIDLQPQEKRGCWSVRGASFVAMHDPFGRVTSTGATDRSVIALWLGHESVETTAKKTPARGVGPRADAIVVQRATTY
ncbi:MAG TPA: hypothetical protein VK726_21560 [Acetobacteraceae bacterium]|jgi:hypothetical protein|nr:hypothetical protein [Acetobacteraceae bacterium]